MNLPWLTILTFWPLAVGLIILFFIKDARAARTAAMFGTLVTLAISLVIWLHYHAFNFAHTSAVPPIATSSLVVLTDYGGWDIGHRGGFAVAELMQWIPSLHINYLLGLDGISLLMILMTTLIWPFIVGASGDIKERHSHYYFWVMLLETAVLGVFLSLNLVLFYVFWEAMLIPMYFIIGIWGGPERIYATIKFFLYTMVGSMIMLVSILALYVITGSHSFDLPVLQALLPKAIAYNGAKEMLLFVGFFLAFGIKAPVWPFHTWVPDAYSQAPTGGTIMLVALKMGLYGFIRFCLPLFPNAMHAVGPVVITFSVIGVIWAAWVAAMQTDLKRLLAYSSISHVGVIMLAIFALNSTGISGALVQMVAHTITTGALFILVGILFARRGSYAIADYGGLMKVMPAFAVVFLVATLSSIALPTTAGFTGEILMLVGAFQTYPWPTAFATTAAIWSVVYMLWMFQRVMHGKIDKPENENLPDLTFGERWALVPLVILIFALGIYPKPILDPVNASVNNVLAGMPVEDTGAPLAANPSFGLVEAKGIR